MRSTAVLWSRCEAQVFSNSDFVVHDIYRGMETLYFCFRRFVSFSWRNGIGTHRLHQRRDGFVETFNGTRLFERKVLPGER